MVILTREEFFLRFTAAELNALTSIAESNAAARQWLRRMDLFGVLDTGGTLAQTGLSAMVTAGVLTPARKTAIET